MTIRGVDTTSINQPNKNSEPVTEDWEPNPHQTILVTIPQVCVRLSSSQEAPSLKDRVAVSSAESSSSSIDSRKEELATQIKLQEEKIERLEKEQLDCYAERTVFDNSCENTKELQLIRIEIIIDTQRFMKTKNLLREKEKLKNTTSEEKKEEVNKKIQELERETNEAMGFFENGDCKKWMEQASKEPTIEEEVEKFRKTIEDRIPRMTEEKLERLKVDKDKCIREYKDGYFTEWLKLHKRTPTHIQQEQMWKQIETETLQEVRSWVQKEREEEERERKSILEESQRGDPEAYKQKLEEQCERGKVLYEKTKATHVKIHEAKCELDAMQSEYEMLQIEKE